MKLTVVLACVCLVIPAGSRGESVVSCYLDGVSRHLPPCSDPSFCTHVVLSSAAIGDDSTFRPLAPDTEFGYTSLRILKHRNPTLKTLLGVEIRQSRLQLLTPDSLENFTASTLKYLKGKNYDGVELTWVEDIISDDHPRTTEVLSDLLKELREQIKKDSNSTGNKSLLLSVSLLDHSSEDAVHRDTGTWAQYVDFISLLPSSLEYNDLQIDHMVKYLQDQGFELHKVLLVLSAFGRKSGHRLHGNLPGTEDGEGKAKAAYGPGIMMANQVCQAILRGETEFKTLTKFESTQSLGEEVLWLLRKGLGGIGLVVLDAGNFADSLCPNLTESAKAILESKVITLSAHRSHSCRGHHPHRHRHHELQHPSHNDSSVDSNSPRHHQHRHHPHGPRHRGHGHRGHGHRGHGHRGHGHHGHGHHSHRGHHGHGHHGHLGYEDNSHIFS